MAHGGAYADAHDAHPVEVGGVRDGQVCTSASASRPNDEAREMATALPRASVGGTSAGASAAGSGAGASRDAHDDWSLGIALPIYEPLCRDDECTPHRTSDSRDEPGESVEDMYNPALLRTIFVREQASKLVFEYDDRIEVRAATDESVLLQTISYSEAMRGPTRGHSVLVSKDATIVVIQVYPVTRTMRDDEDDEVDVEATRMEVYVADLEAQSGEPVVVATQICSDRRFYKFDVPLILGGRMMSIRWFEGDTEWNGIISLRGPTFGQDLVPPDRSLGSTASSVTHRTHPTRCCGASSSRAPRASSTRSRGRGRRRGWCVARTWASPQHSVPRSTRRVCSR
jgi:hypothetical protein